MDVSADFIGDDLFFRNYTHLSLDEAMQVLNCRNDESVRKWMTDDSIIALETHLAYIQKLRTSGDKVYWAVFQNDILIGGVSIVNITGKNACSGIFLNPQFIGSGVGLKVSFYFNEHLFNDLCFKSTYSEVHKKNQNAIKLNKYLGTAFFDKEGLFYDVKYDAKTWEKYRLKIKRLISFV